MTGTAIRLTRAEAFDIANALNREASSFDQLIDERGNRVPEQTVRVWRNKAEANRDLSRRIVLQFAKQPEAA
jgi:hypothetical protein